MTGPDCIGVIPDNTENIPQKCVLSPYGEAHKKIVTTIRPQLKAILGDIIGCEEWGDEHYSGLKSPGEKLREKNRIKKAKIVKQKEKLKEGEEFEERKRLHIEHEKEREKYEGYRLKYGSDGRGLYYNGKYCSGIKDIETFKFYHDGIAIDKYYIYEYKGVNFKIVRENDGRYF